MCWMIRTACAGMWPFMSMGMSMGPHRRSRSTMRSGWRRRRGLCVPGTVGRSQEMGTAMSDRLLIGTRQGPFELRRMLVHRHGLAADGTGACTEIGSTTGCLWVSENVGDIWALAADTCRRSFAGGSSEMSDDQPGGAPATRQSNQSFFFESDTVTAGRLIARRARPGGAGGDRGLDARRCGASLRSQTKQVRRLTVTVRPAVVIPRSV
jgi:hypothetical protein